jgi:hypothetical protein
VETFCRVSFQALSECGIYVAIFRVAKKESAAPFHYEILVLFLPTGDQLDYLGPHPDLAQVDLLHGMWKLGTDNQEYLKYYVIPMF